MWIFASKGRPDRIREVVDGYRWGSESWVLLALYRGDKRLREYFEQVWPANYRIEIFDERGVGPTYNEVLRRYPSEPNYGFLADDAVLGVQGMLAKLEVVAGAWELAYANDQIHGSGIATMPCLGGDLVRAVGYLAPQYVLHDGIDSSWTELGLHLKCLHYFPELTYTHKHPIVGLAPDDKTYREARAEGWAHRAIVRGWVFGGEMRAAAQRVLAARGL